MAVGFIKETEHAFITIGKDIKEGKIPPLVLLCGKEDYLINWYSDMLIKKYTCEASRTLDLVKLEGEQITLENIKEALETLSLMSERKVVYIPDFQPALGRSIKSFKESDIEGFIDYIGSLGEGCLLLLNASEEDEPKYKSKNKVKTAIEKNGKIYDFQPLNDKQLYNFIEKRFIQAKKSCSPRLIRLIMSESGYGNKAVEYGLYNLDNDLKKIISCCGNRAEIQEEDVSGVLVNNPENNVFAMVDAIGKNRKDEAFRLLNNLLESGTSVFALLRMITGQLEIMVTVKEMRNEGISPAEIPKKMGIHQFRVKKALAAANQYSINDLKKYLSAAYDVEYNIKTGLMDSQMALEYFIACI